MLEIDGISKSFFRKRALDGISFSIEKGKITGLLGPNGAGKTTLIRIINNIIEPDRGYISFDGKLLQREQLKRIGYLPEERGLYRSMKVQEHMLFLAKLRGLNTAEANKNINYWVERFAIEDWRNKRIEELSKGMAQKVQFLCTVLHDPDLLILDEPFSGFDPINIELIRKELLHLKQQGKTIILSTHNMRSVEELCDHAVLIHEGEKVLEGKVNQLRNAEKEGIFSLTFSGNMIAFANALWVGYEIIDKKVIDDQRFTVQLKMREENDLNSLLNTVLPHVKLENASEILPSMEEVFMKAVQPKTEVHE